MMAGRRLSCFWAEETGWKEVVSVGFWLRKGTVKYLRLQNLHFSSIKFSFQSLGQLRCVRAGGAGGLRASLSLAPTAAMERSWKEKPAWGALGAR